MKLKLKWLTPPFAEEIKEHKTRGVYVVLVIALLLTFIGLGLCIVLPVLVYSKSITQAMNLKDMLRYTKIHSFYTCRYIWASEYAHLKTSWTWSMCNIKLYMHIIMKVTIVSVAIDDGQHQYENKILPSNVKQMFSHYLTCYTSSTKSAVHVNIWKNQHFLVVPL